MSALWRLPSSVAALQRVWELEDQLDVAAAAFFEAREKLKGASDVDATELREAEANAMARFEQLDLELTAAHAELGRVFADESLVLSQYLLHPMKGPPMGARIRLPEAIRTTSELRARLAGLGCKPPAPRGATPHVRVERGVDCVVVTLDGAPPRQVQDLPRLIAQTILSLVTGSEAVARQLDRMFAASFQPALAPWAASLPSLQAWVRQHMPEEGVTAEA